MGERGIYFASRDDLSVLEIAPEIKEWVYVDLPVPLNQSKSFQEMIKESLERIEAVSKIQGVLQKNDTNGNVVFEFEHKGVRKRIVVIGANILSFAQESTLPEYIKEGFGTIVSKGYQPLLTRWTTVMGSEFTAKWESARLNIVKNITDSAQIIENLEQFNRVPIGIIRLAISGQEPYKTRAGSIRDQIQKYYEYREDNLRALDGQLYGSLYPFLVSQQIVPYEIIESNGTTRMGAMPKFRLNFTGATQLPEAVLPNTTDQINPMQDNQVYVLDPTKLGQTPNVFIGSNDQELAREDKYTNDVFIISDDPTFKGRQFRLYHPGQAWMIT